MKKKLLFGQFVFSRFYFIFFCLAVTTFTAYYCYEGYKSFFEKRKSAMELVAYKISSDFTNILNHAEDTLNNINKKIVDAGDSKTKMSNILIAAGRNYSNNLLQYELSTGKFYWIDEKNRLIANSEYGLMANEVDLSGRDYLQKTAMTPGKIYAGDPIIGASSGQYVIPVGVGAKNNSGEYIGALVVSFKLSELMARYLEIADVYQVNFAVLNSNNEVIIESENGVFSQDKKLLLDLSEKKNNGVGEFIFPYGLEGYDNSYVILRTSDKYQYKILTGYQNKKLQQQLWMQIFIWGLQFILIAIFFVMVIFYLKSSYSKSRGRK